MMTAAAAAAPAAHAEMLSDTLPAILYASRQELKIYTSAAYA